MTTMNRFNWIYSERSAAAQLKEHELGFDVAYMFIGKQRRGHCVSDSRSQY